MRKRTLSGTISLVNVGKTISHSQNEYVAVASQETENFRAIDEK